ncbi:hypothetical protein HD806DRAFT_543500 [Xylariaceae sp. AK1471]|nr:hypothetical protein HD806DRAFT_543500 [Xylariaceae sp. AK1471]
MCRRIITHHMHHDVAAVMIMDPVAPNPVVYANPLRTNLHRCELELPPLRWLLNSPIEKCQYHTCCVPYVQVEYCDDLMAYLDIEGEEQDFEPEECDDFVLEHHHERLPYFGEEGAYRESIPATWRDMVRIRGGSPDWFPAFAHDPCQRAIWEEECFKECEKLYTLENDTRILYAVAQDLAQYGPTHSWSMARNARARLLKAEGELHEQRRLALAGHLACYDLMTKKAVEQRHLDHDRGGSIKGELRIKLKTFHGKLALMYV